MCFWALFLLVWKEGRNRLFAKGISDVLIGRGARLDNSFWLSKWFLGSAGLIFNCLLVCYISLCVRLYVCTYVCMYVCMYIRMYLCMHVGVCVSVCVQSSLFFTLLKYLLSFRFTWHTEIYFIIPGLSGCAVFWPWSSCSWFRWDTVPWITWDMTPTWTSRSSTKATWRFLPSLCATRTHSGELFTFVYTEFIFWLYFYKGNLTFPAVTLCNQNSFRWVVYLCLHGFHLWNVFLQRQPDWVVYLCLHGVHLLNVFP